MSVRVSMLLKSRASLTCFRACFLPGRAKDLSAPGTFAILLLVKSRFSVQNSIEIHSVVSEKKGIY